MAQDASQRWNRTDGVLIAPGTTPEAVADAFAERGVVVRLEWFPATTHLLSLTLMTDVEGRVAVTPPSRGGVVPGPSVSELVESLARQFTADVAVGPAAFNALPDDVELPSISHHGSASARTVVISPMSAYMVPLQATLLERPLAVASAPNLDRRIVMYSGEGTDLGTFGWDEESLPALVLTSDAEDMSIRFSWGMTSHYVWGGVEEPGPALRSLVDELLADLTDASGIVDTVPGADLEAAAAAIVKPGIDGFAAMLEALGLPDWVLEVLTGRLAPVEVPGVVVHEPRGLSNAVGRSVGLLLADPSTPGSAFWQGYVRTVTDKPWAVRGAALLEAGLGGALVGAAVRRRRSTGSIPGGMAAVGAFLLVDAITEVSLASWTRHRELRRRADEEMALVAEELGA